MAGVPSGRHLNVDRFFPCPLWLPLPSLVTSIEVWHFNPRLTDLTLPFPIFPGPSLDVVS